MIRQLRWLVIRWVFITRCRLLATTIEPAAQRLRGSSKLSTAERRLKAFERRLQIVDTDPEWLEEHGKTPLLQLGDFELTNVFAVDRKRPWLLSHSEYTHEFHKRRRLSASEDEIRHADMDLVQRRLTAAASPFDEWTLNFIQSDEFRHAVSSAFAFRTPRERLRVMAVLNAVALPEVAIGNTSRLYMEAEKVYKDEKMGYSKNDSALGNNQSIMYVNDGTTNRMIGSATGNQSDIDRAFREGQALKRGRKVLRDYIGSSWLSDHFLGRREPACSTRATTDSKCFSDVGVALSVYQSATHKILIFHEDWSIASREYFSWSYREWVIDNFEKQIQDQWTIDSRQTMTSAMNDRRGPILNERQERCAFKAVDWQTRAIPDINEYARSMDVTLPDLTNGGLWSIVKKLVRVVYPAGRDRVLEMVRTNYFTGSGFGGVWAALVSMWLQKVDNAKYDTYVIAGLGWQCFARRLTAEMTSSAVHDQIHVYAHVMDTYAKIDRVAGNVCNFGTTNFTQGNEIYDYCSQFVGYTGPQLLYRGPPVTDAPSAAEEDIYKDSDQQRKVQQARMAFDACHYYTHSAFYTAILWINDRILMPDGTTDGGCKTEAPVPTADSLGMCPAAATVDQECLEIEPNVKALPVLAMALVAGGLACGIACIGIVAWAALQRIRNSMWVFGQDTKAARSQRLGLVEQILKNFGIRFTELKKKHKRGRTQKGNRAKHARERAMQARQRKFAQELKKHESSAEDDGHLGWEDIKGKVAPELDGAPERGTADAFSSVVKKAAVKEPPPAAQPVEAETEENAWGPLLSTRSNKSEKADVKKKDKKTKRTDLEDSPRGDSKKRGAKSVVVGRPGSSTDNLSDSKLKVPRKSVQTLSANNRSPREHKTKKKKTNSNPESNERDSLKF